MSHGLRRRAEPVDRVRGMPAADRCLVMGIVNVTPDSFSDGGLHFSPLAAVRHGLAMAAQGADLVDVGGESTRPHASRVPVDEELRRVLPVVRDLSAAGVRVSIDTMRAKVAAAAVEAGAIAINDVSGGLADPDMAHVAADAGLPYVAMHWRAHSDRMSTHASYGDVVDEVRHELGLRIDALLAVGLSEGQLILDPGLGFAKKPEHDWALLHGLTKLRGMGFPVLIGASRKSFLGRLIVDATGSIPPPAERDALTCAVSALAAAAGAYCVRVHDVKASLHAVQVARRWTVQ